MSFELAEKKSLYGSPCLQNYNFQKKCSLMERQNSRHQEQRNINLSEDSSNENQLDEGETEQELMEDPDLYENKESSKGSGENKENKNSNDYAFDLDNEAILGKLRLEGTKSTPGEIILSPTRIARARGNTFCQGAMDRELDVCCQGEPLRIPQRIELMKLNTFDNIPQPEERQKQMENELGSPTKLNKDEYHPLGISQKSSTTKRSLSMSKTKKESTLLI